MAQPQQPLSKLEDLIPYRNSLKDLWQTEDFQPVLKFLSSLYKENVDALVYSSYAGLAGDLIRVQEKAAVAKLCNMLYNLPEVLSNLEEEFERQKEVKAKFIGAQEAGGIKAPEESSSEREATPAEIKAWQERRKRKPE